MVLAYAGFSQDTVHCSRTGIVLMLGDVVVFSKYGKQVQLADSTGYAETIMLHEAAHLMIVYTEILTNLARDTGPQLAPTPVYEDDLASVLFTNNNGPKPGT